MGSGFSGFPLQHGCCGVLKLNVHNVRGLRHHCNTGTQNKCTQMITMVIVLCDECFITISKTIAAVAEKVKAAEVDAKTETVREVQ